MKTLKSIFLLSLIASTISFQSCKKEDPDAPELLPESTFVMSFDDFSIEEDGTRSKTDSSNWRYAATNVVVWNVVIFLNGIVPVAAFRESFNHQPTYDKKTEVWTWSYDFNAVVKHTARLEAKKVGSNIQWEMYISKQGGFSDFLWYSGLSATDRTSGSWTLYKDPNNATPYIGIDWHRNSDGTSDIKYTNIIPSGPENGGYIEYGLTKDTFDAYYDIYNKGKDNLTAIKWSRSTKEGQVSDENHFGDTDNHCWDAFLQNATCK